MNLGHQAKLQRSSEVTCAVRFSGIQDSYVEYQAHSIAALQAMYHSIKIIVSCDYENTKTRKLAFTSMRQVK